MGRTPKETHSKPQPKTTLRSPHRFFSFEIPASGEVAISRLLRQAAGVQPVAVGSGLPWRNSWGAYMSLFREDLAAGQNQWYHFGVGAPPY